MGHKRARQRPELTRRTSAQEAEFSTRQRVRRSLCRTHITLTSCAKAAGLASLAKISKEAIEVTDKQERRKTDRHERRKRGIVALIPSGRFDQTGVPDYNVTVEVVPSANNRVDVEEPVLASVWRPG